MNAKFFIGWAVIFVLWMAGGYLVHAELLHADYLQTPQLFRTDAEAGRLFPVMALAHVIMAGAFVWIYSRGIGGASWLAQGVRFGVAVALLAVVPLYLIYYVVQPMPGATVVKQMVFDTILVVILGIVVAFIYRPPAAPR